MEVLIGDYRNHENEHETNNENNDDDDESVVTSQPPKDVTFWLI